MKRSLRKTRKQRRTKKQRGGAHTIAKFPHIHFELLMGIRNEFPGLTWTEISTHIEEGHITTGKPILRDTVYTLFLLEEDDMFYFLEFNFYDSELDGMSFINALYKSGTEVIPKTVYKPLSNLIIYKYTELLLSFGTHFSLLTTKAVGDTFYKLYKLYRDMGYVCYSKDDGELPEDTSIDSIVGNYQHRRALNNNKFSILARPLQNENEIISFYERCGIMYGYVDTMHDKIEATFSLF